MVVEAEGRIARRRVGSAWAAILSAGLLPLAALLSVQLGLAAFDDEGSDALEFPCTLAAFPDAVELVEASDDPDGESDSRSSAGDGAVARPPTDPALLGLGSDACAGRALPRPKRFSPLKLGNADDELHRPANYC